MNIHHTRGIKKERKTVTRTHFSIPSILFDCPQKNRAWSSARLLLRLLLFRFPRITIPSLSPLLFFFSDETPLSLIFTQCQAPSPCLPLSDGNNGKMEGPSSMLRGRAHYLSPLLLSPFCLKLTNLICLHTEMVHMRECVTGCLSHMLTPYGQKKKSAVNFPSAGVTRPQKHNWEGGTQGRAKSHQDDNLFSVRSSSSSRVHHLYYYYDFLFFPPKKDERRNSHSRNAVRLFSPKPFSLKKKVFSSSSSHISRNTHEEDIPEDTSNMAPMCIFMKIFYLMQSSHISQEDIPGIHR